MVKTLILPGLNGSGALHWQRIWAQDCPGCEVVEQSNWACPNLETWKSTLERRLAKMDEAVCLVAHSLGCWLAADLATSAQAVKISSAFLVAPCDLEVVETLHPCAVQTGPRPDRKLPFPSLTIGSDNDPYMTPARLIDQADTWGSEVISLGRVGHINVESGFGRWRNGYQLFSDFNRRLPTRDVADGSRPKPPRVDLLDAVIRSGLSAIPH